MKVVQVAGRLAAGPLDAAAGMLRVGYTNFRGVASRSPHWMRGSGGMWRIGGTRLDYGAMVGDTARTNSIVVAVVGWMCRNFPEAPVKIMREPKSDGDPIEWIMPRASGPGALLRLLEHPNAYYSGVLQWMATVADWECTGNAYWLKVRNEAGRVQELWWLPSWMVEPRWDTGFIDWYEYTVDGIGYAYHPDNIVHFRNGLDPLNPRKGLSPLGSLFREIFTDDEAGNMTASLVRNLGVPGVVISPANTNGPMGRFSDPEEVKDKFMEKFGGDKRGEPMVMTIPSEIKVLSWSPQQMDMRSLRKIPEERVTAVFGVAAIVAGLGAGLDRSTFSNFGEARKAAYQEGIIPAQRLFAADMEVQLLPDFGNAEGLDMLFDWKMAGAMQEAAAEVWKRYQDAAVKGLITRASFKRAVNEPVDGENDDIYIMANNFRILKPGEVSPEQENAANPPEPPGFLDDGGDTPPGLPPGKKPPKQIPAKTSSMNGHSTEVIAHL